MFQLNLICLNELEIECLQSVWSPVQIKKFWKKDNPSQINAPHLHRTFFKTSFNPLRKLIKILQVHFWYMTWHNNLKASSDKCSKKKISSNSLRIPNNLIIKKTNQTNKTKQNKKNWDIYNKMFFAIDPPVISSPKYPLI